MESQTHAKGAKDTKAIKDYTKLGPRTCESLNPKRKRASAPKALTRNIHNRFDKGAQVNPQNWCQDISKYFY